MIVEMLREICVAINLSNVRHEDIVHAKNVINRLISIHSAILTPIAMNHLFIRKPLLLYRVTVSSGVITNGGVKPNIIPEIAELLYSIRAPTVQDRDILAAKVYACFNAAATATGCSVRIVMSYSNDPCREHTGTARMRICVN